MLVGLLVGAGLVGLVVMAAGYYFARSALYPTLKSPEEAYRTEVESDYLDESAWAAWPRQEVRLRSPFGYEMFGYYLPLEGAQHTVILAHGYTYNLYGQVKYVDIFRKRGFNVVLYDHRAHGQSGGSKAGFGYFEKYDMQVWFEWALARLGPEGRVGVMGESYGAATALQYAALEPRVAFVVADCGYSDLWDLFTYHLRVDYHLPAFPFMPVADWWCQRLAGYHFRDVSPRRDVARTTMPMCFIHGAQDAFTPPTMSQENYAAKTNGARRIYLAPGAEHAGSFGVDRVTYDRFVGAFLAEAGFGVETAAPVEPALVAQSAATA